jgi:RNA polymerase sigma-70 factor, ECF subfamily
LSGAPRMDDAELVAEALRAPAAYGVIVGRYEGPLLRYLRRLLGPHGQAAEDVLQEAFVKAYVNLNDFDRSRPLAPWLYRIARNEALSLLRKRRAEPRLVDGEDGQLLLERMSDGTDAFRDLARKGARSELLGALAAIGARYRDVLVLRFLEEKSYADIADILHLPPGTVATLVRRGLARLKAALLARGLVTEGEIP